MLGCAPTYAHRQQVPHSTSESHSVEEALKQPKNKHAYRKKFIEKTCGSLLRAACTYTPFPSTPLLKLLHYTSTDKDRSIASWHGKIQLGVLANQVLVHLLVGGAKGVDIRLVRGCTREPDYRAHSIGLHTIAPFADA